MIEFGLEGELKAQLEKMIDYRYGTHFRYTARIRMNTAERMSEEEFDKYLHFFDMESSHPEYYSAFGGWGHKSKLCQKAYHWFLQHRKATCLKFITETYGSYEAAVEQEERYEVILQKMYDWFQDRRMKMREQMLNDIMLVQQQAVTRSKKTPQSHGAVANLLKILTRTMEKQGADIKSIAKVQYAVCTQAGIYIPDEFLEDCAVCLTNAEGVITE